MDPLSPEALLLLQSQASVLDALGDMVGVVGSDGLLRHVNAAGARRLGCPGASAVGRDAVGFCPPDGRAEAAEMLRRCLQGESVASNLRLLTGSGEVLETTVRLTPGWWMGQPAVVLLARETPPPAGEGAPQPAEHQRLRTLKMAAVAAPSERQRRDQLALLDSIPDLAWVKDHQSNFLAVNEPMARACGAQREDLAGRNDFDIWPAALAAHYRAHDAEVIRTKAPRRVLEPLETPAGRRWIETTKMPILDEEGQAVGTAGIARDVTEEQAAQAAMARAKEDLEALVRERAAALTEEVERRKQTERDLHERNQWLQAILGQLPAIIWATDASGRFTCCLGTGVEGLRVPEDFLVPGSLAEMARTLAPARNWLAAHPRVLGGETLRGTFRLGERWLEWSMSPLRQEERIHGAVAVTRDVTEREHARQDKQHMADQLAHVQRLESLGVLAGGIAHDFNNLLTPVLANATVARDALPEGHPAREPLEDITRAARRAAELVHQMLVYAGKGQVLPEPLDLSRVVADMASILAVSIPKGVALEQDLAASLPVVVADAVQLRQVVLNLMTNAAESMEHASGRLRLVTRHQRCDRAFLDACMLGSGLPAGEYVVLVVEDQGCGIPPEAMARMFDPFFSTKFTGRGLGLPVVAGILKAHRGAIHVDSRPGQGTRVTVVLPASPTAGPARAPTPVRMPATVSATVLVVDDEDVVRRACLRVLRHAGAVVREARNGQEALDLVAQDPSIQCALLDMTMPGMDGAETFRRLRVQAPQVKVVMMSGHGAEELRARLGGTPPEAVLAKPFDPAVMLELVSRFTAPPGTA